MYFDAFPQYTEATTPVVEAHIKIQESHSGTLQQKHGTFGFCKPSKFTYLFAIGNHENSEK
jgi:hypothetical protein